MRVSLLVTARDDGGQGVDGPEEGLREVGAAVVAGLGEVGFEDGAGRPYQGLLAGAVPRGAGRPVWAPSSRFSEGVFKSPPIKMRMLPYRTLSTTE